MQTETRKGSFVHMKKLHLLYLAGLMLLSSCTGMDNSNNLVSTHDEGRESIEIEQTSNGHQHEEQSSLSLNDGAKWKVNVETTESVESMIRMLAEMPEKESSEAYHALAEKLSDAFAFIFEQCTMTGEGHNQLHTFLSPIQKMIIDIKSDNIAHSQAGYNALKKQLDLYTDYFESE